MCSSSSSSSSSSNSSSSSSSCSHSHCNSRTSHTKLDFRHFLETATIHVSCEHNHISTEKLFY